MNPFFGDRTKRRISFGLLFVFLGMAVIACDDTSSSGSRCNPECLPGLECVDGTCICSDSNCCTTSDDCDPGQICNPTTYQCCVLGEEGCGHSVADTDESADTDDIDGDEETDTDGAETVDEEPEETACVEEGDPCAMADLMQCHTCNSETVQLCTPVDSGQPDGVKTWKLYECLDVCTNSERLPLYCDMVCNEGTNCCSQCFCDCGTTDGDVEETEEDVDWDTPDGVEDEEDVSQNCAIEQRHTGVEILNHLEDIQAFRQVSWSEQVTSADPSDVGDDMAPNPLQDGDEKVVVDVNRPGCITRMWFSNPEEIGSRLLSVYLNGSEQPVLDISFPTLFNGLTAPFLSPLVKNTGDAYLSYVPICFTKSVKVTIQGGGRLENFAYQFTYGTYSSDVGIEDFSIDLDLEDLVAFYTESLGTDPKPFDLNSSNTNIQSFPYSDEPAPGYYVTLANITGPGVIERFLFDISPKQPAPPYGEYDVLRNVRLQIFFDGKSVPDVDAPVDLFFGSGFGEDEGYTGLMNGMTGASSWAGADYWYSFWPMPFKTKAVARLVNNSPITLDSVESRVYFRTLGEDEEWPRDWGHFHATYNEALPATGEGDYEILHTSGRGHYVGTMLGVENGATFNKDWIEGDERVFVDGSSYPQLVGTGLDHMFNGGRQWSSSYAGPFASVTKHSDFPYQFSARRFYLSDAIPFNTELLFNLERVFEIANGAEKVTEANYRSLAMYYRSCLGGMVLSDQVDFGNPSDRVLHDFDAAFDNSRWQTPNRFLGAEKITCTYQGNECPTRYVCTDARTITTLDYLACEDTSPECRCIPRFSGVVLASSAENPSFMEVTMAIDPENVGLRLSRVLDYSFADQEAEVWVGSTEVGATMRKAGVWRTPGRNQSKSWREDFFDVPYCLVQDLAGSVARLRFLHTGGNEWNIYDLKVYSYLSPDRTQAGPGIVDVNTIQAEYELSKIKLSWQPPAGTPPAYYHIYTDLNSPSFSCTGDPVATVETNSWNDPTPYPAQSSVYYKILSEDCMGQRSEDCSETFTAETPLPPKCVNVETAVDLLSSDMPADPDLPETYTGEIEIEGFVGNTDGVIGIGPDDPPIGYTWVGERSTSALVIRVKPLVSGSYNIGIRFAKGPDYGKWQLSVQGISQGEVQNGFNATETVYPPTVDGSPQVEFIDEKRLTVPTGTDFYEYPEAWEAWEGIPFVFKLKGYDPGASGSQKRITLDQICLEGTEEDSR